MAKKNVSAAVVREFLNSAEGQAALAKAGAPTKVGQRGKFHADQIAVFNKANKGKVYETGSDAEKPTVTVPVTSLNKAGIKTTKNVTLTTEQAREVLGEKGKRGRFNKSNLSDVLSQIEANAVASQFTKNPK